MNEELPDDMRDLLARERTVEPPPAAAKARVLERLNTSTPPPASAFPLGKAMIALGVVTIVSTYFALRTPAPVEIPVVQAPPPSPPPIVPTPQPRAISLEPTPEPPRQEDPPPARPKLVTKEPTIKSLHKRMVQPPAAPRDEAEQPERPKTLLAAERAVLDSARSSLGHRDLIAARVALKKHEREFPNGQLEEEREALWVIVLDADQEPVQALDRARAFRERWPTSIFLRGVTEAEKRSGGQLR